jgi:hypothetical protein
VDNGRRAISGRWAVPGAAGARDSGAMPTLRDKLVELAIIRWQLREQALAATKAKQETR